MTKKHDQAVTQDNDQDMKDLEDMLEDVKDDVSGDYKNLLVALLNKS